MNALTAPRTASRTALIVDDSRSARFALRKYLESQGIAAEAAESAHAAYKWLDSRTPDLIFLDHIMPGEDGLEALRQLKANPKTASIPVVICSSNEGDQFVVEMRRQGAADVLQKPPTAQQLQRVLLQIDVSAGDAAPAADAPALELVEAAPAINGHAPEPPAAADAAPSLAVQLAMLRQQHQAEMAALKRQFEAELAALQQRLQKEINAARVSARDEAIQQLRGALVRALGGPL